MKYNFSNRLRRLGTETAFAVSLDAAAFAEKGNKVYPFHLGDINIPTPSNIMDATNKALRDGKTGYNSSNGIVKLRSVIASISRSRNWLTILACMAVPPLLLYIHIPTVYFGTTFNPVFMNR